MGERGARATNYNWVFVTDSRDRLLAESVASSDELSNLFGSNAATELLSIWLSKLLKFNKKNDQQTKYEKKEFLENAKTKCVACYNTYSFHVFLSNS